MSEWPAEWVEAAVEAAHHALDNAHDYTEWHYGCYATELDCEEYPARRRMLAEDVIPAILDALRDAGALPTPVNGDSAPPHGGGAMIGGDHDDG